MRSCETPEPSALALIPPSGLVDIEDRLLRESLSCFCMGGSQGLGDLLMKFADGSQTDVNGENSLGYFPAAPASYSVQTRQMGKQCGEPWPETRSSRFGELRPGLCPARAPDALKVVFGDFRFGLRNINDLMTPIFAGRMVGIRGQQCAATITCVWKHWDYLVDIFGRYQVPVGPLVTRLAAGIALLGFHRGASFGLGSRSIG